MKKLFPSLVCLTLLTGVFFGCERREPTPDPGPGPDPVIVKYTLPKLEEMTLEQKVGQMFNIRVENLTGSTAASKDPADDLKDAFQQRPCGGFTLFAANIINPNQILKFNDFLHGLGSYPLLCIDEEGGTVARIGRNSNFNVPTFTSMGDVGATGNTKNAFDAGSTIGSYLFLYSFDVDLAPVADVNSNPENPVIGKRAFSSDPQIAAEMSSQFLLGLQGKKVEGCLKHFPGHGDTQTDSHYGFAETLKTWDEMLECEMIPFKKGIETGARMVMTAHISAPNVTGSSEPSTLSKIILTDKLRGELGFQGIIITDAMGMGAITQAYSDGDAAIKAIKAGADIILCPADYADTFDTVVHAVENGTIEESRINESVARILALKKDILTKRELLAD